MEGGPVSIAGDAGLCAGLSLALIHNRFICFSQDYETFQTHACQSSSQHFMNGGLLQLAETTNCCPTFMGAFGETLFVWRNVSLAYSKSSFCVTKYFLFENISLTFIFQGLQLRFVRLLAFIGQCVLWFRSIGYFAWTLDSIQKNLCAL